MEWHGDEVVDALKQRSLLEGFAQLLTEENACRLVAFVFQLVDEVLHLARLGEEEASRHGMKPDTAIERLCQWVLWVEFIAGFGQKIAAFQADCVLIFEQRLTAGGAHARVEQVEDAMEPFAEGHGWL